MTDSVYDPARTGLLLVDPYNDFLSPEGKLWPLIKDVAQDVNLVPQLRIVVDAARQAGVQLFYVPHHRWVPGDYSRWKHATPYQIRAGEMESFAEGSWGGTFHDAFTPQPGDVIIKEHWNQSGFANTDLDQQLKQHGIEKIIVIGLVANTCIEGTSRFGMELGYHVTLVTDATAAASWEMMRSAHEWNGPTFAHAIVKVQEIVAALSAPAS